MTTDTTDRRLVWFALTIAVVTVSFGYRSVTARDGVTDTALAELRTVYARGEMHQESEQRRTQLEIES